MNDPKKIDVELTNLITPSKRRGKLNDRAYLHWRDMGADRTFSAVAEWAGVSTSAVCRYAARHGWERRRHLEDPVRIAEVSHEVRVRVKAKTEALVSVDPAEDAAKARKVRGELLATGLELLELGKKHLEAVPLETKDVLKCIELGAKLMQAATVVEDKGSADVVLLMREKLARLQEPVKNAEFKEINNGS